MLFFGGEGRGRGAGQRVVEESRSGEGDLVGTLGEYEGEARRREEVELRQPLRRCITFIASRGPLFLIPLPLTLLAARVEPGVAAACGGGCCVCDPRSVSGGVQGGAMRAVVCRVRVQFVQRGQRLVDAPAQTGENDHVHRVSPAVRVCELDWFGA